MEVFVLRLMLPMELLLQHLRLIRLVLHLL
jgi:hypothetical protein